MVVAQDLFDFMVLQDGLRAVRTKSPSHTLARRGRRGKMLVFKDQGVASASRRIVITSPLAREPERASHQSAHIRTPMSTDRDRRDTDVVACLPQGNLDGAPLGSILVPLGPCSRGSQIMDALDPDGDESCKDEHREVEAMDVTWVRLPGGGTAHGRQRRVGPGPPVGLRGWILQGEEGGGAWTAPTPAALASPLSSPSL